MKYTVNSVARTGLDPTPPYAGSPTHDPGPVRLQLRRRGQQLRRRVSHVRGHDQPAGADIQTASTGLGTATTWLPPDGNGIDQS